MLRALLAASCVLAVLSSSAAAGQAGRSVPGQGVMHIECRRPNLRGVMAGRAVRGARPASVVTDHFSHSFIGGPAVGADLMRKWPQDENRVPLTEHPWAGSACADYPAFVLETAFYLEKAWSSYAAGLKAARASRCRHPYEEAGFLSSTCAPSRLG